MPSDMQCDYVKHQVPGVTTVQRPDVAFPLAT